MRTRAAAIVLLAATAAALALWAADGLAILLCSDLGFHHLALAREAVATGAVEGHFQPAALGMAAAVVASGLDGIVAVKALLTVQLAIYAGVFVAASGWLRRLHGPQERSVERAVAALVWIIGLSPAFVAVFVNGTDSVVVLLVHAWVLAMLVRERAVWGLGAALALAVVARPDGLVLAALAGWQLGLRRGWWVGLRVVFLPVLAGMGMVIAGVSGVPLRPEWPSNLEWVGIAAIALAGIVLLPARGRRGYPVLGNLLHDTWAYGAFTCVTTAWYGFVEAEVQAWRLVPLAVFGAMVAIVGAMDMLRLALAQRRQKLPRIDEAVATRLAGSMVLAVAFLQMIGGAALVLTAPEARSRPAVVQAARLAGWALPRTASVSTSQPGVFAFFAPQRVGDAGDYVVGEVDGPALGTWSYSALRLDPGNARWVRSEVRVVPAVRSVSEPLAAEIRVDESSVTAWQAGRLPHDLDQDELDVQLDALEPGYVLVDLAPDVPPETWQPVLASIAGSRDARIALDGEPTPVWITRPCADVPDRQCVSGAPEELVEAGLALRQLRPSAHLAPASTEGGEDSGSDRLAYR